MTDNASIQELVGDLKTAIMCLVSYVVTGLNHFLSVQVAMSCHMDGYKDSGHVEIKKNRLLLNFKLNYGASSSVLKVTRGKNM